MEKNVCISTSASGKNLSLMKDLLTIFEILQIDILKYTAYIIPHFHPNEYWSNLCNFSLNVGVMCQR